MEIRTIHEIALKSAKSSVSDQTGFVHYCYHSSPGVNDQTIPTYENFCYVLALFNTKMSQNVTKGGHLLKRLLAYQQGNFPIYLHDHPHCFDRWHGVNITLPIYWIYTLFNSVLGEELKRKLECAARDLINHCLSVFESQAAEYQTALKIGCAAAGFGTIFHWDEVRARGEVIVQDLAQMGPQAAWFTSEGIGEILLSLRLVYSSLSGTNWSGFLDHLKGSFDWNTGAYIGPAFHEFQEGSEPRVNLYDLFLALFSGRISRRALAPHPQLIPASQVFPFADKFEKPTLPTTQRGEYGQTQWVIFRNKDVAFSLLSTQIPQRNVGFQPIRMVWGDDKRAHTLVCEGGNVTSCRSRYDQEVKRIEVEFVLGEVKETEDRLENRELCFFHDEHADSKKIVLGLPSTTFRLENGLDFHSQLNFSINMDLIRGEGQFMGHLMLGNRPSQIGKEAVWDSQLFLRTIRREQNCHVRVTVQM